MCSSFQNDFFVRKKVRLESKHTFYVRKNYFETTSTNMRSTIPPRTVLPRRTYFAYHNKSHPRFVRGCEEGVDVLFHVMKGIVNVIAYVLVGYFNVGIQKLLDVRI